MQLVVEHPLDPAFRVAQLGFSVYLFVVGIVLREQLFVWPALALETAHSLRIAADCKAGRQSVLPRAANIVSVAFGIFLAVFGATVYGDRIIVAPIIVVGALMALAHTRQLVTGDNMYYYLGSAADAASAATSPSAAAAY